MHTITVNLDAPRSRSAAEEVHIIDPCSSREWMEFIASHPHAGIFHHPAWMTMLRDIYGYRVFAVCLKDGERIRAGIPFADVKSVLTGRRWISLPFSDYCEPLLPLEDDDANLESLVRFLREHRDAAVPKIEIRWRIDSLQPLFHAHNFVLHTLMLENDPDAVLDKMNRRGTKNRIAKVVRDGVIVRECRTLEQFDDFYSLQLMTRKRLGVPAQPKYFFDAVWKYIIEPGLGFVLISYKDEIPIGGGVFFKFGSSVCFKYSASDFAYRSIYPNHAYICEAIRRSCKEGYRVFDFGRSDVNNVGLRTFKSRWGAKETSLCYTMIANEAPHVGATTRLDAMTSFVIRHSPLAVCKLSGELLYKHFA